MSTETIKKAQPSDTLSPQQIRTSMTKSHVGTVIGTPWFLVATPTQILAVYFKNVLGVSSAQLGLLFSLLSFVAVVNLIAPWLYAKQTCIKKLWVSSQKIVRSFALTYAFIAYAVSRGFSKDYAFVIMSVLIVSSMALFHATNSGWVTWLGNLVPEHRRSTFFTKRSVYIQLTNIISLLVITLCMDIFHEHIFVFFAILFALASGLGFADVTICGYMDEPDIRPQRINLEGFLAPLKNKQFLRVTALLGIATFAIQFSVNFLAPYITSETGLGIPNWWIGFMFFISQGLWVLTIRFWGLIMEKFGRKHVVLFGLLYSYSFLGYIVVGPGNYVWLLPIIAAVTGIFSGAFMEGTLQLVLQEAPTEGRNTYIAWYLGIVGLISSLGPIIGGIVLDLSGLLWVVIAISCLITLLVFVFLLKMPLAEREQFSRVLSVVVNPGIFRSWFNQPIMARSENTRKVMRALELAKPGVGEFVVHDVIARLSDPDDAVRIAAIRALGSIGGPRAERALIRELRRPIRVSTLTVVDMLGQIGSIKAAPRLYELFEGADSILQEAIVKAISQINDPSAYDFFAFILVGDYGVGAQVMAARGIARRRAYSMGPLVVHKWFSSSDDYAKHQYTHALADLIAGPGSFAALTVPEEDRREAELERLVAATKKSLSRVHLRFHDELGRVVYGYVKELEDAIGRHAFDKVLVLIKKIFIANIARRITKSSATQADIAKAEERLHTSMQEIVAGDRFLALCVEILLYLDDVEIGESCSHTSSKIDESLSPELGRKKASDEALAVFGLFVLRHTMRKKGSKGKMIKGVPHRS